MQQRRVRLGDILDDYCPRERRITNHAVVAMIEDEVKQTRCTTCDADHEYKQAKVPAPRRKKPEAPLPDAALLAGTEAAAFARPPVPDPEPPVVIDENVSVPMDLVDDAPAAETPEREADAESRDGAQDMPEPRTEPDDEWPVHRPLIRATLPRPDGQAPERKAPDFTIRQNGRFDGRNNGNRHRGQRQAHGQSRFGNSRSGSGHGQSGHGQQRHGNRQGGPQGGQRGGGRPPGHGRGQGRGPKRGR
jgi:hypothetical protein